jgi:hypothetical protein
MEPNMKKLLFLITMLAFYNIYAELPIDNSDPRAKNAIDFSPDIPLNPIDEEEDIDTTNWNNPQNNTVNHRYNRDIEIRARANMNNTRSDVNTGISHRPE